MERSGNTEPGNTTSGDPVRPHADNTAPAFRLKVGIVGFLVVMSFDLFQLVLETARNYAVFGISDVAYLAGEIVLRSTLIKLPFIALFSGLIMLWLGPLHRAIAKGYARLVPTDREKSAGRTRLVYLPTFVIALNVVGVLISLAIRIIRDPGATVTTTRVVMLALYLISSGCVAGLLTSSIAMAILIKPATWLDIRYIRADRHEIGLRARTVIFSVVLVSYCLLHIIDEGRIMDAKTLYYTQALERLYEGRISVDEARGEYARQVGPLIRVAPERVAFPLDSGKPYGDPGTRELLFFMFVWFIGLVFLFQYLASLEIVAKINAVNTRIGQIVRGGDLSQRIAISDFDEIGHLSSHTNLLVSMMTDILRNVSSVSNHILAAAEQVEDNAARIEEAANGVRTSSVALVHGIRHWVEFVLGTGSELAAVLSGTEVETEVIRSFLVRLENSAERADELLAEFKGKTISLRDAMIVSLRQIESAEEGQEQKAAEVLGLVTRLEKAAETNKNIVNILRILLSGFKY
jgi:hypothetical protein